MLKLFPYIVIWRPHRERLARFMKVESVNLKTAEQKVHQIAKIQKYHSIFILLVVPESKHSFALNFQTRYNQHRARYRGKRDR